MINLQRLEYIKEHNASDSLMFVVDYILQKIQRDRSEFSRYSYDEDWSELDNYISKMQHKKSPKELETIKKMLTDISDSEEEIIEDNSFEKTLLRHLKTSS